MPMTSVRPVRDSVANGIDANAFLIGAKSCTCIYRHGLRSRSQQSSCSRGSCNMSHQRLRRKALRNVLTRRHTIVAFELALIPHMACNELARNGHMWRRHARSDRRPLGAIGWADLKGLAAPDAGMRTARPQRPASDLSQFPLTGFHPTLRSSNCTGLM